MPRLAQILPEIATVKVEAYDMTVSYRPGALTPAEQDRIMDLMEKNRQGPAFAKIISRLVASWDLTGDDDQPYPVTEESLRDLPMDFLANVLNTLMDAQRPNEVKPKTSAGSF